MKLFLGIISLIISTSIGFFLSKRYTLRKKFYYDFFSFNKTLKTEISFAQNSLLSFIENNKSNSSIFYVNLYRVFIEKNKVDIDENLFSKEEISFFEVYLNSIGASDKQTQLSLLDSTEVKLNNMLKNCEDEEKKYKSLYVKLGFLIGLIVLILII